MIVKPWWLWWALQGCVADRPVDPSTVVGGPVASSFDAGGVSLRGRHGSVRVSFRGPEVEPRIERHGATFRREGMTEIWASRPEGLEHSFVVEEPVAEIVLPLAIDGAAVELVSATSAVLHGPTGDLTYGGLEAQDADGNLLPAWMEATDGGLALHVSSADAAFPVVVDPVVSSQLLGVESNQAYAWMGYAVAGVGDVNGDGHDDVVVGAPYYDGVANNAGAIFLYLGTADGVLSATPAVVLEGQGTSCALGYALAAAGDVNGDGYDDLVAGVPGYGNGQTGEGAVFVYFGAPNGFEHLPWRYESNQVGAALGTSVAGGDVNGDGYADIAAGAPNLDVGRQTDNGAVLVFRGNRVSLDAAPWFTGASPQSNAHLGRSVALGDVDGNGDDDVVAGAPDWDNGQTDEGRVTTWLAPSFVGTSSAESNQASAHLGASVAVGDLDDDGFGDVLAGAPTWDADVEGTLLTDAGVVLGYFGQPVTGMPTFSSMSWSLPQAGAQVGASLATGDVNADGVDDLVVGAPYADDGQTDEGRALVFAGSATAPLEDLVRWSLASNQTGAHLGASVAVTGVMDPEHDIARDVLVGAPEYDSGQTNEGRAQLFDRLPSGFSYDTATYEGDLAGVIDLDRDGRDDVFGEYVPGYLGVRLSGPGGLGPVVWDTHATLFHGVADLDGDGELDIVRPDGGGDLEITYSPLTSPVVESVELFPGVWEEWMTAADVTGDGIDDLLLGSLDHEAVHLYPGGPDGVAGLGWTEWGPGTGLRLMGPVPDLTGDGRAELLIHLSGHFALVAGSPSGFGATLWELQEPGYVLADVADLDGDGGLDFVFQLGPELHVFAAVGATLVLTEVEPFEVEVRRSYDFDGDGDRDLMTRGSVTQPPQVFRRTASGFELHPAMTLPDVVGLPGDLDGDGYGDLVWHQGDPYFGEEQLIVIGWGAW